MNDESDAQGATTILGERSSSKCGILLVVSGSSDDNTEELRAQLRALEERVARLEAERSVPPAKPEPEPVAEPESQPPAEPPAESAMPSELRADWNTPWPVDGKPAPSEEQPEAAPSAPAERSDLESFFGMTVLGRIGIVAVVAAAAYFGQLGWRGLGPGTRAVCIYALGVLLLLAGWALRSRVRDHYVASLWGGGVAVTYVAGVLACLRFEVMSRPLALAALLATTVLGQWLARLLRLEAMATIALGGGYMAPVLVGSPSSSPTNYFALLLLLHGWAAWTEHRWQWHSARALAVFATTASVLGWLSENGPIGGLSYAIHLTVVWLLLALPELLRAWARKPVALARTFLVVFFGFAVTLSIATHSDCVDATGLWYGGALLLFGALFVPREANLGSSLARMPMLLLPIGVMRVVFDNRDWSEWRLAASLLVVGAVQLIARRWTRVGELGLLPVIVVTLLTCGQARTDEHITLLQSPLVLVAPILLVCFARPVVGQIVGLVAGVAACLVAYLRPEQLELTESTCAAIAVVGGAVFATFGSFLAARRSEKLLSSAAVLLLSALVTGWFIYFLAGGQSAASEPLALLFNVRFFGVVMLVAAAIVARAFTPKEQTQERLVLGAVAIASCYVGGLLELLDFVHGWEFGPHAAATSIYSLAFAGTLLVAGFRVQMDGLRWTALAGFGAVAVKVAFYDLSEASTPMRVLVTGVLGAVLLVVAWGYARTREATRSPPPSAD